MRGFLVLLGVWESVLHEEGEHHVEQLLFFCLLDVPKIELNFRLVRG